MALSAARRGWLYPDLAGHRSQGRPVDGSVPQLSQIRLKVKAVVPGIDATQFRAIADDAKQNCPVSKALSAVPISLEAELA